MNGAESIVQTLLANRIDTCFANPGTSEMQLVHAIDGSEGFNAVLCLFEGVCTGAADGYARMRRLPATTLLHLGAGLGNGIANLHNCRRAGTPLINIVGDHAINHVPYDAPLTSDVEIIAQGVSSWTRTASTSQGLGLDTEDAFLASMSNHPDSLGNISTLIVPADCAWGPGVPQRRRLLHEDPRPVLVDRINRAVRYLDDKSMLLIDGSGLRQKGLEAAGRIAKATGCQIYSPTFPARVDCGPAMPIIHRMPYFPEHILALMENFQKLVIIGGKSPVSFFAYQDQPSYLVPDHVEEIQIAERHEDIEQALLDVVDALGANDFQPADGQRPEPPSGPISVRGVVAALAAAMPENAIVTVDSGSGGAAYPVLQRCVPHTWMNLTGGSIGMGGPAAVGAAIACPDRAVYCLLGDGGAMYTNQFLWTAAREQLDITAVIFNNRQYNILEVEYLRMGVNQVGDKAAKLFDIGNPEINWVDLAKSQGVPGSRVSTCEEMNRALAAARSDGPYLIEVML